MPKPGLSASDAVDGAETLSQSGGGGPCWPGAGLLESFIDRPQGQHGLLGACFSGQSPRPEGKQPLLYSPGEA